MKNYNQNSDLRLGLYLGRHASFSGGIGVYVCSLIDHYLEMLSERKISLRSLVLYGDISLLSYEAQKLFDKGFVNSEVECELKFHQLINPQSRFAGFFLDQFLLPRKFSEDRITLLHSLANIAFVSTTVPQIATIHDLYQGWPVIDESSPFTLMDRCKSLFYKAVFKLEAYFLTSVITDARQTALEVLKFLPLNRSISPRVIPLGLDQVFVKALNNQNKRLDAGQNFKFEEGYVLLNYSSNFRKNFIRSLAAWRMLPQALQKNGIVILGAAGKEEEIKKLLGENFNDRLVHCVTHLTREELPSYIVRAGVLLAPTLAEGFGFPAIEAVALGTPVVTGRLECLENLPGDLVYYCDPRDEKSIRDALLNALSTEKVARSEGLNVRTMREVAEETFAELLRAISS